jgi:hypothetical protein
LHTCFSKSLKKTSPTCSFATSSLDMRAVWMVRLDLQFTAIHNATILKIHAWMLTLTDECRCQLRMLHEHANDQTYAQHIHVSKDHETWHCTNVFLNAYRKHHQRALSGHLRSRAISMNGTTGHAANLN